LQRAPQPVRALLFVPLCGTRRAAPFPYTTLFRSERGRARAVGADRILDKLDRVSAQRAGSSRERPVRSPEAPVVRDRAGSPGEEIGRADGCTPVAWPRGIESSAGVRKVPAVRARA